MCWHTCLNPKESRSGDNLDATFSQLICPQSNIPFQRSQPFLFLHWPIWGKKGRLGIWGKHQYFMNINWIDIPSLFINTSYKYLDNWYYEEMKCDQCLRLRECCWNSSKMFCRSVFDANIVPLPSIFTKIFLQSCFSWIGPISAFSKSYLIENIKNYKNCY